jgi:hypothetical protein
MILCVLILPKSSKEHPSAFNRYGADSEPSKGKPRCQEGNRAEFGRLIAEEGG